jgi:hypothetical protein
MTATCSWRCLPRPYRRSGAVGTAKRAENHLIALFRIRGQILVVEKKQAFLVPTRI